MTRTETVLQRLLAAATELAEARRHDSDTAEEWDGLERGITAAEEATEPTYAFDEGQFVRRSTYSDGSERVNGVDIEDIEQVAIAIDDSIDVLAFEGRGWFVVDELVAPSGRTWTRCLVAIECLKHLGLLHERALDHRISRADGFGVDAAIEAFKRAAAVRGT